MQKYKAVIAAAIAGGMSGIMILCQRENATFFDVINRLGFYEFYIDSTYIAYFLIWYFPLLMFEALWGTFIYRHFCMASIYCFSRVKNRLRWFLSEALKLYAQIIIYLLLVVCFSAMPTFLVNGMMIDISSIQIFIYYMVIHSLWLYITTLIINVIAVKFESSTGFLITLGVQICMLCSYIVLQDVFNFDEIGNLALKAMVLKCNPLSHLVLKWHSSGYKELNSLINEFNISFDLNESIVLFLLLSVVATLIGCIIVKKQEFIIVNKETGGTL